VIWDCELPKTPEGFYHIQAGIDYAIAKSLAVAPFADVLWMETKTADLEDARSSRSHPRAVSRQDAGVQPLAVVQLGHHGMNDEQMKRFPEELGKLGFVFNFITYGGHQIDGLAAEEFATALKQDGMLALARLQRKFRLLESPYRTPQTLVGGPRLDAALMASSGRTAATKAMGKGVDPVSAPGSDRGPDQTAGGVARGVEQALRLSGENSRPATSAHGRFELLELSVLNQPSGEKLANVVFAYIQDRRGRGILSIRDQNTLAPAQEASDDGRPTVPHPPLQCQLGALRHPDRGQRVSDTKDEERGDFLGCAYRDWPNHRRASQQGTRRRTAQA
jgi:isocitrate lyase